MYAIIKAGGKQYTVAENDVISINRLDVQPGDKFEIKDVLLVNSDGNISLGSPFVEGASVECEAVRQFRGKKINGYTYKPKKDEHKHYGHRQDLTEVKISKINL